MEVALSVRRGGRFIPPREQLVPRFLGCEAGGGGGSACSPRFCTAGRSMSLSSRALTVARGWRVALIQSLSPPESGLPVC